MGCTYLKCLFMRLLIHFNVISAATKATSDPLMNQIHVSSNIFNIINTERAWNDHCPEFPLGTI